MAYRRRNGRRCGSHKSMVEGALASSLQTGRPLMLLDNNQLRGLRSIAKNDFLIPFDVIVVERDQSTVLAQTRLAAATVWPKSIRSVSVVHADVHQWLATAPLQHLIVWLDLESSTIPRETLRLLDKTHSGWCTVAARGGKNFGSRFAQFRAHLPRIDYLGGYQRKGGMVMYNVGYGTRPVPDSEVDYEVKGVRIFNGLSGKAICVRWWGFPKERDQHAFYVDTLRCFDVDGTTATVQLATSTVAFTAPIV